MTEPTITFFLRLKDGQMTGFEATKTRAEVLMLERPEVDGDAGRALIFFFAAYAMGHCPCGNCLMAATGFAPARAIEAMAELRKAGWVVIQLPEDLN